MSLTIQGSSVLPREACKKLLQERNANAALEAVDHYYQLEPVWGIRGDVLCCQMFHETGYMTSWWSLPPRRNPAGIGVTGETSPTNPNNDAWIYDDTNKVWAKGYTFEDWTAAVLCHFAHMSAYVFEDERNNASKIDPRYSAAHSMITSKKWPVAQVLTDLNGRWAVPGTTYGQTIEDIYNAIASLK